nr:immunoglobulin heavy chain junction region [Macaca mulatta]
CVKDDFGNGFDYW